MKKIIYGFIYLFVGTILLQGNTAEEGSAFERARKKLETMISTNEKFVRSKNLVDFEAYLLGQSPVVTLVACSDSRVQSILLHNDPTGNLFTVRNIGNQVKSNEGSVDYGVAVLKTPILLILGHTDCGAVKAVIKGYDNVSESIKKELNTIDIGGAKKENEAVVNNVNSQVEAAMGKYKELVDKKELFVIGAIYDMNNVFGHGHGSLVFTNLNGVTDNTKIREHELFLGIEHTKVLK